MLFKEVPVYSHKSVWVEINGLFIQEMFPGYKNYLGWERADYSLSELKLRQFIAVGDLNLLQFYTCSSGESIFFVIPEAFASEFLENNEINVSLVLAMVNSAL